MEPTGEATCLIEVHLQKGFVVARIAKDHLTALANKLHSHIIVHNGDVGCSNSQQRSEREKALHVDNCDDSEREIIEMDKVMNSGMRTKRARQTSGATILHTT